MPGTKRRTGLWIGLGIFLTILLAWQFYKYKIANKSIHKAVSEKSKGLYSIRYDSLLIDEVGGALHVKNVEIRPDTAVYRQLMEEGTQPSVLLTLTIPQLDITGVKTPKALLNKEIEGGKIRIVDPIIEVELDEISKDSTLSNPGKEVYKELLGKLLKIKMDSVEVVHANLLVKHRVSGKMAFKGLNVSILLSDLSIDSIADKDSSRILFSRDLELAGDELELPSKNKRYRMQVEKLHFTSRNNSFYLGTFKVIPQLPEEEFAASFPTQKDRYDFTMEGISLLHIDRESLWNKSIEADSLIIHKSAFRIYHDLSFPRDTVSKVGKYPQQQLMHIPFPLLIRKVIFEQSFIEYKEKNPKSGEAGKLQFYDAQAAIDNVTNRKSAISRNNRCSLLFSAKFLDKAPVHARLVMLLRDPHGRFTITGGLGHISVLSLNPLTMPMGLARMEKGEIHSMNFDIKGDDSSGMGKVTVVYDDLKVALLKKDKEEDKYDKKGLTSLFSNIFIKNSNPGKNEKIRVADVQYERALNRSFFSLIWKSIFTGVKQNVGIKK